MSIREIMTTKYCIIPDEEKLYTFLSGQQFTPGELMQLRLLHISQICVDESACNWEVHFTCAAHLTPGILETMAARLAEAFALAHVDMVCDGDGDYGMRWYTFAS